MPSTLEIVEAIVTAMDELPWVRWAKQRMRASVHASQSAAPTATPAPARENYSALYSAPDQHVERYGARRAAPVERENYNAEENAIAWRRETAMSLCEKAAIAGQRPSYEMTLKNVSSGNLQVALVQN